MLASTQSVKAYVYAVTADAGLTLPDRLHSLEVISPVCALPACSYEALKTCFGLHALTLGCLSLPASRLLA